MSALDRVLGRQVRHVTPGIGSELAAAVCRQITDDVGAVLPPYLAHLPAPDVLAACWAITREPSVGTAAARRVKEAVAAAVSATNACPYCLDVHTATLYALDSPEAGSAIAAGRDELIPDPELRKVVDWARATRSPGAEILAAPPFTEQAAAELVGTALAYHYINRMVSVFLVDSPFGLRSGEVVKRGIKRLAAPVTRRALRRAGPSGQSLEFLPETEDRGEFGWASSDPVIAAAFRSSAAVFDAAARRFLAEPVQDLVRERLRRWRGEPAPLSAAWVEEDVVELPAPHRPAGRLTLLVALAPYQVGERVLGEFRATTPGGEQALVAAAGWASFTATLRVGEWIWTPATTPRTATASRP